MIDRRLTGFTTVRSLPFALARDHPALVGSVDPDPALPTGCAREEAAQRFVQSRLDAYERMWDG